MGPTCNKCGSTQDVAWVLMGYDSDGGAEIWECAACHLKHGTEWSGQNLHDQQWERNLFRLQRDARGIHPLACHSCDEMFNGWCCRCDGFYNDALFDARTHLGNIMRLGVKDEEFLAAIHLGEKAGTDEKELKDNPFLTHTGWDRKLLCGAWWHGRDCMLPTYDADYGAP